MNRSMIICRLRWPALLLLTGIIALFHQLGIMSWGHAWPLYLILLGVLALAERAAIASDPAANIPYGAVPYGQATNYPGYPYPPPAAAQAEPGPTPPASTGIVPSSAEMEQHRASSRADFRSEESHGNAEHLSENKGEEETR